MESKVQRSRTGMVVGTAAAVLLGFAWAPSASAEPDVKIQRTWKAKCASCHGVDGKGATEMGKKLAIPDFTGADWQKKASDETMKKSISEGLVRPGKTEGMDAYKDKLDAAQIDGLIALVRTLK